MCIYMCVCVCVYMCVCVCVCVRGRVCALIGFRYYEECPFSHLLTAVGFLTETRERQENASRVRSDLISLLRPPDGVVVATGPTPAAAHVVVSWSRQITVISITVVR